MHGRPPVSPPLTVTARVLGTPVPGLAVWRAVDDGERSEAPVAGDLEGAPPDVAPGDLLVLVVERSGFRWEVREVLDHLPGGATSGVGRRAASPASVAPRPTAARGRRARAPHAHPSRPPGSVVIAWLPFTAEPTAIRHGVPDDVPGKHRPCVVLHSADPDHLRVRPLYDAGSAHARRVGGPRLQAWRAAGLDKASVVVAPVDVPLGRVAQTLGRLSPVDRRQLGIT